MRGFCYAYWLPVGHAHRNASNTGIFFLSFRLAQAETAARIRSNACDRGSPAAARRQLDADRREECFFLSQIFGFSLAIDAGGQNYARDRARIATVHI